jgi:hypothetical protein
MKCQEVGEKCIMKGFVTYSSPSIIRMIKLARMRWEEYVVLMGQARNAYKILVVKPEGKRPLRRPICRCVDNIKMNIVGI